MVLEARLEDQKVSGSRRAARRELKLRVSGPQISNDAARAFIHNLSSTGLLIETSVALSIGQEIIIDLPEVGERVATVVWENDQFYGCALDRLLSSAAVSAAVLRSEPTVAPSSSVDDPDQLLVGGRQTEPFGKRLKRLRKERGLSLVELAKRMNVSRPTVWSWEACRSLPRPSKVKALSDVLGVVEDVLDARATMPEPVGQATVAVPDALSSVIHDAKNRIAAAAGTSAAKITLIIEV